MAYDNTKELEYMHIIYAQHCQKLFESLRGLATWPSKVVSFDIIIDIEETHFFNENIEWLKRFGLHYELKVNALSCVSVTGAPLLLDEGKVSRLIHSMVRSYKFKEAHRLNDLTSKSEWVVKKIASIVAVSDVEELIDMSPKAFYKILDTADKCSIYKDQIFIPLHERMTAFRVVLTRHLNSNVKSAPLLPSSSFKEELAVIDTCQGNTFNSIKSNQSREAVIQGEQTGHDERFGKLDCQHFISMVVIGCRPGVRICVWLGGLLAGLETDLGYNKFWGKLKKNKSVYIVNETAEVRFDDILIIDSGLLHDAQMVLSQIKDARFKRIMPEKLNVRYEGLPVSGLTAVTNLGYLIKASNVLMMAKRSTGTLGCPASNNRISCNLADTPVGGIECKADRPSIEEQKSPEKNSDVNLSNGCANRFAPIDRSRVDAATSATRSGSVVLKQQSTVSRNRLSIFGWMSCFGLCNDAAKEDGIDTPLLPA